jgi:hypothetical protein
MKSWHEICLIPVALNAQKSYNTSTLVSAADPVRLLTGWNKRHRALKWVLQDDASGIFVISNILIV